MESKEAPPQPTSEASSGSIAPLTYSDNVGVEGPSVIGKAVDVNGNDDDKGAVSEEEEGYVSGYEEFETDLNKDVVVENPGGSEGVVSGDFNEGVGGGEKFVEAAEELKLVDKGDTESVVDGVMLEVAPAVAEDLVLGGAEENGDLVDKHVEEEGVAVVEPEKLDVVEPEILEGDVKPTREGDSVVDTIQVDVVNVGGTAENGDVEDKITEEVVESEKVEVDSRGDVKLTGEGDSAIQVDVANVGGTAENGDVGDKMTEEVVEPEKVEVDSRGDMKLTGEEGDSAVDDIQVDVAPIAPEVAVGGTEENMDVVDKQMEEIVEPEKLDVDNRDDVRLGVSPTVGVASAAPGVPVIEGSEENEGVVDKLAEEVVEPEKLEVDTHGDVDSVVDAIQVDVAPTAPGVAVVGATGENIDVVDKPMEEAVEPEKLNVDNRDDVGLTDGDSDVDSTQVEVASAASEVPVVGGSEENEDVVDKLAEPEKLEVDTHGDVNLTGDGDSVVDDIQVDVAPTPSEVAVVGAIEENTDVVDKPMEEAVEPEKLDVDNRDAVKLTDGDSIQVEVASDALGVPVVGESEENEDVVDKLAEEVVEPEKLEVDTHDDVNHTGDGVSIVEGTEESGDVVDKPVMDVVEAETNEVVSRGDIQLTDEGDSVVDTIQVDKVGPGVAVVGESGENGVEKIGVDVPLVSVDGATTTHNSDNVKEEAITEPAAENTADVAKIDGVESEAVENGITDESTEEESKGATFDIQEIGEFEDEMDGVPLPHDDSMSEEDDIDGMIFGGSEAAKKFMEDLERESGEDSHTLTEQSRDIDGQIVTDSEEGETDDDGDGDGKELFDSAALAALLKAATGGDSGGPITITSQDGSRLFSVERPAGLGSSLQSLRPAPRTNLSRPSLFSTLTPSGDDENMTDEEKKKLEKLQEIRVKFLRLVHRLGLPTDESVAAQVLYRLALLGGRQNTQNFNLEAAKKMALELEADEGNELDFSLNLLVIGKSGVGKSATINSLFGEEKASINAFQTGTDSVKEISGLVDGVNVRVLDTPGLKPSVVEQRLNRSILSSVKKLTKKTPPDVVLYVDRLDSQSRDLNDLPLLKTITTVLGSSIWRNAIVTLTHSASAPPDGPTGNPLSYEVFVSQRSHIVQQSIGNTVGDLRMMTPSVMNPVALVENHLSCRKNREDQKILPNGQIWRPQLLLLCYSMKILSEANALSKPQDPFDHRKLFGFRARSPPLPYMLSSMLQSRAHPKLASEQSGENADSDIDLDEFSDSDPEEEDEYDQLPPFKPLKKAQISALTKEQKNAYFEEFDYRVKLAQKKQWKEELKRLREFKKRGTNKGGNPIDYDFPEDDGAAAPVAVPLPDMALPPSFDGDNPAYRYRFLEPTSQFLARPVLDTHGWDHDCGYDGVNLEHSLGVFNRFPAVYTVQITKDKKDFTVSLDSSIAAKHGDNISTMAGFDIQGMGKQLAYIFRGETKVKNLKRNKVTGGISFTLLGENVVPALKVEDQVNFGKRYTLVGSVGAVKSQQEAAYGANFELQRREIGYPIGPVQSTVSMSLIKWRGDLAVGLNLLHQLNLGRNSKVAVRAGINNKMSGQVTVRTSSSEHLSIALAAIVPTVISVYRKVFPSAGENYHVY